MRFECEIVKISMKLKIDFINYNFFTFFYYLGEVTVAEKGRLLFQGATHSLLAGSVVKGQGRIDVYQATVRISSKIFQIPTVRSYGNNGILYIKRVAGMDNLKSLSVSGRGKIYLSPSNATQGRPLVVDKVNMQQAGSIQLPGSVTIHE